MKLLVTLQRNKSALVLGASLAIIFSIASGLSPDSKPDQTQTPSGSAEVTADRMSATIKHCNDGDTCRVVTTPGHMWMNVRLAGIDAPERANKRKKSKGQPMGDAAADFLNRAVVDKQVEIEQTDLDGYNRPVVIIWLDQKNVNLQLVEDGYAEVYRGPAKRLDRAPFEAAEGRARAAKKGIWGLPDKERQSPAEFRKELRQREKS